MIIIKLIGGLGNQMFQYALGRHLAIKNGTVLKFDISDLINSSNDNSEITIRNYELNNFNIEEKIASKEELVLFKDKRPKILRILEKLKPYNWRSKIYEKGLNFDQRILNIKGDKYLAGYWQSELYFNEIRDFLLNEFSPKKTNLDNIGVIADKIKSKTSISLHVRRGDYVKAYSNHYHVQDQTYYSEALQIIKQAYSNCNLFVFSDDIQWCKDNLNFEELTYYVEPNQSFEDIYLMSLCSHNIIANSSFSWWGAWLNKNPEKICIAPKKWFKNKNKKNNIIPKNWITI
jgi:hypothetical protein